MKKKVNSKSIKVKKIESTRRNRKQLKKWYESILSHLLFLLFMLYVTKAPQGIQASYTLNINIYYVRADVNIIYLVLGTAVLESLLQQRKENQK